MGDRADDGAKNRGLVCSNEVVALVCVVKKAELKGETLDILVCLCFTPHLWS